MTPSEHFLRHAAECKFMAQLARDPESKEVWIGMADRWRRCAELADRQTAFQAEKVRKRRSASSH